MAVKDYTGPVIKLKQTLVFDFKDFSSMLARMIKDRGFSGYIENYHNEFNNPDGSKTISFGWTAAKKLEPYLRQCAEFMIKAVVHETVVENDSSEKTMYEGNLEIDISSYMMRDVEDEWGFRNSNPTRRFLRDLYDKVLNVDKMATYEKRLKSDVEAIINDIKAYMKINRLE